MTKNLPASNLRDVTEHIIRVLDGRSPVRGLRRLAESISTDSALHRYLLGLVFEVEDMNNRKNDLVVGHRWEGSTARILLGVLTDAKETLPVSPLTSELAHAAHRLTFGLLFREAALPAVEQRRWEPFVSAAAAKSAYKAHGVDLKRCLQKEGVLDKCTNAIALDERELGLQ